LPRKILRPQTKTMNDTSFSGRSSVYCTTNDTHRVFIDGSRT